MHPERTPLLATRYSLTTSMPVLARQMLVDPQPGRICLDAVRTPAPCSQLRTKGVLHWQGTLGAVSVLGFPKSTASPKKPQAWRVSHTPWGEHSSVSMVSYKTRHCPLCTRNRDPRFLLLSTFSLPPTLGSHCDHHEYERQPRARDVHDGSQV